MRVPEVEKPWSRITVAGFHRMARPPATPFESVWYESQVRKHILKIYSTVFPLHFVS
jgi:hypothetical protein